MSSGGKDAGQDPPARSLGSAAFERQPEKYSASIAAASESPQPANIAPLRAPFGMGRIGDGSYSCTYGTCIRISFLYASMLSKHCPWHVALYTGRPGTGAAAPGRVRGQNAPGFWFLLRHCTRDSLRLTVGHTPDSDDAFMFYGMLEGGVPSPGFSVEHVVEDIEALNKRAASPQLDVTAVSVHACAYIPGYTILRSGGSFGLGYGPIVTATDGTGLDGLRGRQDRHTRQDDVGVPPAAACHRGVRVRGD